MPVTSWSARLRSRRNESISSMKMIAGWSLCASENKAATSLFDSPNLREGRARSASLRGGKARERRTYHLSVKVETCMLMKVAPDSLARACSTREREESQRLVRSCSRLEPTHLGQHRLAAARRTVHKDALGRAEEPGSAVEQLRVDEREDDGLAQLRDDGVEAADVCVAQVQGQLGSTHRSWQG